MSWTLAEERTGPTALHALEQPVGLLSVLPKWMLVGCAVVQSQATAPESRPKT